MPELRGPDGALTFFHDRRIQWWRNPRSGDGPGTGPTRNLASSQVCCVNFLLPLAVRPGVLEGLLKAIDPDVLEVVPVEYDGLASRVELEWVGWKGPLEGGRITRGANQTSADALIVARTTAGHRAYVLEWKYCEQYQRPEDKGEGPSGETRRQRYLERYSAVDSPFNGLAPLDEFLFEPFYQIMRLLLLARKLRQEGVTRTLQVDDVRVLVICPEANLEYRRVVKSTPLAKRFLALEALEEVIHATLKAPRDFAMVGQEGLVEALRRDPCAGDLDDWLEYHRVRYGW